MPDIRTILRSLAPDHALRNARRDVVEHARVVAEIDAIVSKLGDTERTDIDAPAPQAATAGAEENNEPIVGERRAS